MIQKVTIRLDSAAFVSDLYALGEISTRRYQHPEFQALFERLVEILPYGLETNCIDFDDERAMVDEVVLVLKFGQPLLDVALEIRELDREFEENQR